MVRTLAHTQESAIRPWGYYTVLTTDQGYKVKQLTVLPGRSTSLQFHFYRSGWVGWRRGCLGALSGVSGR